MVLSRQGLGPRNTFDASTGILITSLSCLDVPNASLLDIYGDKDAHFVEIPQGKFRRGQTTLRRALSIAEREFIVLFKDALVPAQKPLADGHFGLGLTLMSGQGIVMQREHRVKVASQLAQFVSRAHFDLCLGEAEIRRFLDVDPCRVHVRGEEQVFRDIDLGQFADQQHPIHIRALWSILIARLRRYSNIIQSGIVIPLLTMLTK